MLAGRDSEFAPSDAELSAAWAAGVRVWGCYFAGPNVANGWSDTDILRVKAKGFVVIAFCSGYADPAAMGARAQRLGILVCLDDESGMRPDGDWVEPWCAAAGAGLYGNGSFHYNATGIRKAAFHIFAGYFGYDPGDTWPNYDVRPSTPCAWQWLGGHIEFGGNVDSAWYDDSFRLVFGSASRSLGGNDLPDLIRSDPTLGGSGEIAVLVGGHKDPINPTQEGLLSSPAPNGYGYPWRNVLPAQYDAFPYLSDLFKASAPVDLSPVEAAIAAVKAELDALKAATPGAVDLSPISAAVAGVQATVTAIRAKTDKDLS